MQEINYLKKIHEITMYTIILLKKYWLLNNSIVLSQQYKLCH